MQSPAPKSKGEILQYFPNLIGYVRIVLLVIAWLRGSSPWSFILLYCASIILDGIDGWAARYFKQASTFGAWMDVVIDIIGRQLIWSRVSKYGWLVGCVEWLVFVCTHQLGAAWKSSHPEEAVSLPTPVACTMQNGFRSRLGVFTIAGLHVLPVWLFIRRHRLLTRLFFGPAARAVSKSSILPGNNIYEQLWRITEYGVLWMLILGRIWCFFIEMWFVWQHAKLLLLSDIPEEYRTKAKVNEEPINENEEAEAASDDEDSF
ncbi:uncharacterized protein LOC129597317 [Paramacrobiotus metropolitanus]|uniref:uncharacterized protein LOC129597317 n=1 Tax=Paramacrobiotus metropolitanus TaxID=2943436 RepID=UPI00244656D0|nr:uncharacterized protein LOC129597317 [Paramacrobiotus metropolitanus]